MTSQRARPFKPALTGAKTPVHYRVEVLAMLRICGKWR
jgi:hypothetical protein